MKAINIVLAAVGLLLVATASYAEGAADIDSEAYWRAGRERLAALGRGFVVWESNRTGHWRIWTINLDGSGLRQLSPDEPGREHFCPHISPDGTRLVYLSCPSNTNPDTPAAGEKVPLHLMSADGRFNRVIVDDVRSYGGDRAVLWLNNHELVYIDPSLMTRRLDIDTGKSEPLLAEPAKPEEWGTGWLIEPTFHYATSGRPTFSIYDAQARRVNPRPVQGGCEPYFTYDGVWGFWMGGAGGPVNRFNLATGQVSPIIQHSDPRLPKERCYVYFPMVSRCGRLFTFGASPNQHDHNTSDYDIFVAQMDPKTLELIGNPVRYTFDKHTDRYPDVFLADLELGEQSGEAPYTARFAAKPSEGGWAWSFGDGSRASGGATAAHTYARPGEYEVQASLGTRVLRGRVRVLPSKPPTALAAWLESDREIAVSFDEPVQIKNASIRLASGVKIAGQALSGGGRTLLLRLAGELKRSDSLVLDGVLDRAERPNRMAKVVLPVRLSSWPADPRGLVFAWATGDQPNQILDASGGRACRVTPHGRAWLDAHYAMRFAGGSFHAEDTDDLLLAACKKTNQLTLEAVISAGSTRVTGPARIVTFSSSPNSRNFTLGQEGDKLILRLRTPSTGENGVNPELELCTIAAGKPTHIAVTYVPGKLTCYRDGQMVLSTDRVQGDFGNWSSHHLLCGNEWTNDRPWVGTLEGVAIFSRALTPEEVQADYQQYRTKLLARRAVPRLDVEAKLVAISKVPTLKEIQPYRTALVTCEYEVEKVLSGTYAEKRIRVAEWALLDGETMPVAQAKVGSRMRLLLEPLQANPQLQSIYLADTLEENWNLKPYFRVNGM